jgi:hypothetical protein
MLKIIIPSESLTPDDNDEFQECQCCNKGSKAICGCLNCKSFQGNIGCLLCYECKQYHLVINQLKDHELTNSVEDFETKQKLIVKTLVPLCPEHSQHLEFYCKYCSILTCAKCVVCNHMHHEQIYIDDKAKELKYGIFCFFDQLIYSPHD